MNALEQLERMGYRFRLEGESVRYSLYGGNPPPEAEALLKSLDKNFARDMLTARAKGYQIVQPDVIRVPWPQRYRYMGMIRAAQLCGELADVKVTFIRSTGECVYELLPPGVNIMKYDPQEAPCQGAATVDQ